MIVPPLDIHEYLHKVSFPSFEGIALETGGL